MMINFSECSKNVELGRRCDSFWVVDYRVIIKYFKLSYYIVGFNSGDDPMEIN